MSLSKENKRGTERERGRENKDGGEKVVLLESAIENVSFEKQWQDRGEGSLRQSIYTRISPLRHQPERVGGEANKKPERGIKKQQTTSTF